MIYKTLKYINITPDQEYAAIQTEKGKVTVTPTYVPKLYGQHTTAKTLIWLYGSAMEEILKEVQLVSLTVEENNDNE